jgi:hypothetical protein
MPALNSCLRHWFLRSTNLNKKAVFFLGLLSTPLPYLLLAAFYFFGFAMGMFNNKTGDEKNEIVSSVTIPAEVAKKAPGEATFYYQINPVSVQQYTCARVTEQPAPVLQTDTGPAAIPVLDMRIRDFQLSGFRFCRPPPSVC